MLTRAMTLFLTSLCGTFAYADLPTWVTNGVNHDVDGGTVVSCSAEGLDPQKTRILAESECLASAARSNGVDISIQSRTSTALSGVDSTETVEIRPISASIKCAWLNSYLEKLSDGAFRVWLQCKVANLRLIRSKESAEVSTAQDLHYARAILTVTSVPKADVVLIVGGTSVERPVNMNKNVQHMELYEGDHTVIVRRIGYQDQKKDLPNWKHGDSLSLEFVLSRMPLDH